MSTNTTVYVLDITQKEFDERLAWLRTGSFHEARKLSRLLTETDCLVSLYAIQEARRLLEESGYKSPGGNPVTPWEIARFRWFKTTYSVAEKWNSGNWSHNERTGEAEIGLYVVDGALLWKAINHNAASEFQYREYRQFGT